MSSGSWPSSVRSRSIQSTPNWSRPGSGNGLAPRNSSNTHGSRPLTATSHPWLTNGVAALPSTWGLLGTPLSGVPPSIGVPESTKPASGTTAAGSSSPLHDHTSKSPSTQPWIRMALLRRDQAHEVKTRLEFRCLSPVKCRATPPVGDADGYGPPAMQRSRGSSQVCSVPPLEQTA